jgi:hypothetical protein
VDELSCLNDLDEQAQAGGAMLSCTFIAADFLWMASLGFGSGCLNRFEI